ncbi:MAG: LacI family DNA-binding transcriptional regulator [Eubacterium sp.]|nr:LacI family DNA-binding transcriptional regulator [Eubacterium sp.]
MKTTMQTIAELAGVSRATVDKVVHNRPGVNEETRRRIKELINETGFQPVQVRKALRNAAMNLRIAVIMPELQEPFMKQLKKGTDAAAARYKKYGLKAEYYYYSPFDPQSVIAILNYLKSEAVNAIAVRGIMHDEIRLRINDFVGAGIPVFTFDADLPDTDRLCFIGEDLYRTGQLGASLLCMAIGYHGEIAVLTGASNVETSIRRLQGFSDYIAQNAPDVRIVSVEETLTQPELTYQKTAALLERYPDLAGIWNAVAHSEHMARAVIDAGRAGRVRLGSMVFSSEIARLVKDHTISYTIGLLPEELGNMLVDSIFEYLVTGLIPPENMIRELMYIGVNANIDLFC